MFLLCLWRVDEDIRHLNKIIISCQTPYLAYKEYPTKYGKLPWGHVLYDCPRHRDGSQGLPLKTLGLKLPRGWTVRCRPSKHRFASTQPAAQFYLLQIASKETAQLVQKYTSCLKSQKWCNWNTEFPTIIYFMAIQIQFNWILMHSTSRTGFYSFLQFPLVHYLTFTLVSK